MNPPRKFPGFGYTLLLMLLSVALIIGFTVPIVVADLLLKTKWVEHPAVMGCINLAAFGAVIALGAFFAKAPLCEVFPMKPVRPALALPLVLSVVGAVIVLSEADNWMRSVLPMPQWLAKFFTDLIMAKNSFWGSLFALVVVAPLTEELFFRGLVMHGFLSRYSVRNSVLVSAILFGVIHLNPWQLISGVSLGLLLGWWFVRTRSLLPCLAGHALANGTLLFAAFFPFRIAGFNAGSPLEPTVQFQPLWFDLLGMALLVIGVWLFAAWTHKPQADNAAPIPPVV